MIRRFKKTRNYHAPRAVVQPVEFESSLLVGTMRLNAQVDELQNMNLSVEAAKRETPEDPFYFEF